MWHTKEIKIYFAGKMELKEVLKQTDRTRSIDFFQKIILAAVHVHVCSVASVVSSSLQL